MSSSRARIHTQIFLKIKLPLHFPKCHSGTQRSSGGFYPLACINQGVLFSLQQQKTCFIGSTGTHIQTEHGLYEKWLKHPEEKYLQNSQFCFSRCFLLLLLVVVLVPRQEEGRRPCAAGAHQWMLINLSPACMSSL